MSTEPITFKRRKTEYDFEGHLFTFYEKREELGQKKYGVGKKNAGWRRDNLMDVIEEVTDALTIMGFLIGRFEKVGDPMHEPDVRIGQRIKDACTTLVDLANETAKLRDELSWRYPGLLTESVKRAVELPTGDD